MTSSRERKIASATVTPQDAEILTVLADYRLLVVSQLATVLRRNVHTLRKRLRILRSQDMVAVRPQALVRGRGRPEAMVSLSATGAAILRNQGVLDSATPTKSVLAENVRCIEHDILSNELRVQLECVPRLVPALRVRYFSPHPSGVRGAEHDAVGHEHIDFPGADRRMDFLADGVFAVTHTQLGKTLLFFVEVDMGTQPLASAEHRRHVSQKLTNYQALLQTGQYRRYEQVLNANLRGFRLLLLTSNHVRLAALCRLVRESPPSEFVWLTEAESLYRQGAWAPIWSVAGQLSEPTQSILGQAMPTPCPGPDDVRQQSSA